MASASIWTQANAKLRYNQDGGTGLSIGAGFFGGEVAGGVDLGGGRHIMLTGEVYLATGAGQQGVFGDHPTAPRCNIVNNSILLWDNYDLSASSNPIAYHRTNGDGQPLPWMLPANSHGQVNARTMVHGIMIDDKLLIGGHLIGAGPPGGFGFTVNGWYWVICDNISDTPNNWSITNVQQLTPQAGFYQNSGNQTNQGWAGIEDISDGYIYFFGTGPGARWSIYRVTKARAKQGKLRDGEWWNTDGTWAKDRYDDIDKNTGSPLAPRGNLLGFTPHQFGGANYGQVHKRASDNKWQMTAGFFFPVDPVPLGITGSPDPHVSYSLTSGTSFGQFPALTDVYDIPESRADGSMYNAGSYPHLTWSGAGANDQVWAYNFNGGDDFFPRVVKATSVT